MKSSLCLKVHETKDIKDITYQVVARYFVEQLILNGVPHRLSNAHKEEEGILLLAAI
ncbi:MAG: hypothetical protein ACRDAI_03100 [Candidatus Rhabdochlamydia sp.]